MTMKNRNELKLAFQKGAIPTQEDFISLIDSFVHKEEDGFYGTEDGMRLVPTCSSNRIVSFLKNINSKSAIWCIETCKNNEEGFALNFVNQNKESKIFIDNNGFIGISNFNPQTHLDVNGNIQSHGRRGTYVSGKVLGDGNWHPIIEKLSDCHVFEIVAKISKYGQGMHSIIHAIATNTFNGKKNDIKATSSYYGSYRNKIELRWTGENFNYNLEIRTKSNYSEGCYIEYYVTNLWW